MLGRGGVAFERGCPGRITLTRALRGINQRGAVVRICAGWSWHLRTLRPGLTRAFPGVFFPHSFLRTGRSLRSPCNPSLFLSTIAPPPSRETVRRVRPSRAAEHVMKPERQLQSQPRKIVGFHLDERSDWIARLECGHPQYVGHNPPWTQRHWVTTVKGRLAHIGDDCCVRLASRWETAGNPRT